MAVQQEKVYIAVGKDSHQGSLTLLWALRNWSSQSTSFVILHVSCVSKDFVYTPFGKLPTSSVNEGLLEASRMEEKERVDKLMGKYLAVCCKVKAEVLKIEIERSDESIPKILIELISSLQIRKLVMGITFTKSLSRKVKDDTSVPYYVHKRKPEFCETFIVYGGKLVFLREENDDAGYFEDEQGMVVADLRKKSKEKSSLKGWIGKILIESSPRRTDHGCSPHLASSSSTAVPDVTSRWEDHCQEIENYIQSLISSNAQEMEEENETIMHTVTVRETGALKAKIEEVRKMIKEKKIEAKANVEGRRKAEWFTSLCNQRAEEIEADLKEEKARQAQLREELDEVRAQLAKVSDEVVEDGGKLKSMLGLNADLMIKLELSSWEKSRVEAQLEKLVSEKTEMAREVEEIRRQRDTLLQKIKHYRGSEVLAAAAEDGSGRGYRELTAEEVRDATDDFSECMVIEAGTEGTLYKGAIGHTTVAIQFKNEFCLQFSDEFKAQVELLRKIRHPNVVAMVGACEERRCIVFEYMDGGTLHDALFSSSPRRTESAPLPWHARIRIAAEVASALGFLHSSRPRPAAHGRLSPCRVLLNRHLSAKLVGLRPSSAAAPASADVAALGSLVLQLLTGREAASGEEVRRAIGEGNLMGLLDRKAGDWPLDLAAEFAGVGLRCAETPEKDGEGEEGERTARMVRELEDLKKRAEERKKVRMSGGHQNTERKDTPNVFVCPILQEVMKEPHVAADGFSYELEAIKEWLDSGHDTSPMTNLKLNNKHLTPNHTLRSLIDSWQQINQYV